MDPDGCDGRYLEKSLMQKVRLQIEPVTSLFSSSHYLSKYKTGLSKIAFLPMSHKVSISVVQFEMKLNEAYISIAISILKNN